MSNAVSTKERAFVYVLCGDAAYIRMLHRSLEFLRARTALPIIVVTDRRRNEIEIDHSIDHCSVIDVKTPDRFDHHQASIFLKTGLHRILPSHREYAYLDTDVIACEDGVDGIFGHRSGAVTFAADFTYLEACVATFSRWAVRCSCQDEGKTSCSHLAEAIERKFGISVPNDWVHWNGGVFLFGPDSFAFMETWHTMTLQIFEDPYWRVRDQGTLIAAVWKLGLERLAWLPSEFNFIVDLRNADLRFDPALGYALHEALPCVHPTFLHALQAGFDRADFSVTRDIEERLEERNGRAVVGPTPPALMLSLIADRLDSKPSPRKSIRLETAITASTAPPPTDYRVIVGRPRSRLSGESVFCETLVRGLQKRGLDARMLFTEEGTDLPQQGSWGARWGTLVRYLEEWAPCVYLPVGDWRNSNVCAHLSDSVRIAGIVHNGDPRYFEQVERLGRYWNAIVTPTADIASRVRELRPELAGRIVTITAGVEVPDHLSSVARGGPLRIVYHGRLDHRQKRIFDLPRIVEGLLARHVPVELTIVGDGPDREQLMTESHSLIEQGAFRWLGILSHDQTLEELERHDVFLLISGVDGLPQAVLEAMARGCVPVVSDTAGLSTLVLDDINGYRVPAGDLEGFCRRLETLHREPARLCRLSRAARQTVIEGGFRSDCMAEAYSALFQRIMGPFHRPAGLLRNPPYQVAGTEVFPIHYFRGIENGGVFPSFREDYEDYRNALPGLRAEQLPVWREELVNPYPVIIASGINMTLAQTLAEGLRKFDHPVQVLVPAGVAPDTVQFGESAVAFPTPAGEATWRARDQALADYLESQAPCLYLPGDDWLHWSVCPFLSDRIGVIGRIDDMDSPGLARVAERGTYSNAIVAGSVGIAECLIRLKPNLSSRVVTIPQPMDSPNRLPERPFALNAPLRVAPLNRAISTLNQVAAALAEHNVPIELTDIDRADVFLVVAQQESSQMRLVEAMARGCVPVIVGRHGALTEFVRDGENGFVLPEGDILALVARMSILQRNPALRRMVSIKAFVSAKVFDTVDVFVASYWMLFERVLREIDMGVHRRRRV